MIIVATRHRHRLNLIGVSLCAIAIIAIVVVVVIVAHRAFAILFFVVDFVVVVSAPPANAVALVSL